MGIVPCPLTCHTDNESESNSNQQQQQQLLHSESSTSLSSQPSLPSIPSLNPQGSQRHHHHHYTTPPTTYHCISTLKAHSSYVFSLALAGKFLYSGSSDREIRSWPRHPLSNPNSSPSSSNNIVAVGKGAVKSLVISGDKLFSAHQDHKIRVWRINNNNQHLNNSSYHQSMYKLIATLPTLSDRVLRLLLPNNHVQVRRHKKCTWVHHVDTISALALSHDGSLLYSVSWDRTFKLWRTSDFKCLESVSNAHDDAINALALSNDGYLYTGSADTKIKVWGKLSDHKKHSLVATLEKHKSAVNALALTTDGSVLYSGACDRSIVVWEKDSSAAATGGDGGGHMVVVGALRGHTKAILCLSVVSDLVCSGSADKTVRIWRRSVEKSYYCLAVLEGHGGPVKCLTAAIDRYDSLTTSSAYTTSYLVYSGSLDCDIKVWQILVPSP
ncbi:protein JINGUBANG-like [Telopea speciosissima]|uniref:protein JINGUBANG-like n=1 Tax=Telopea speciosissima TaxID=54955 RepID=UPI001CC5C822|nr:protein JINGUBANG-like [Telopea speciosissima]XP_043703689.1 protein JINGUBANG-like [Telopea speciosissima]